MNGIDVYTKITANNKKIEDLINPAQFVLNAEVQQLLKENEQLRSQCEHEYENGVCKYCGKEEN